MVNLIFRKLREMACSYFFGNGGSDGSGKQLLIAQVSVIKN
jgi:hypothetical protein